MFMALEDFDLYAMERTFFMFMALEDFDLYAMEMTVFLCLSLWNAFAC